MFPLFSYVRYLSLSLLLLLVSLPLVPATDLPDSVTELNGYGLLNATWLGFMRFLDAGKGSQIDGMAELKQYFHRFGYHLSSSDRNFTDLFDEEFEKALLSYQRNLGLSETGKLDSDTMKVIVSPRCGMADSDHHPGGHHHDNHRLRTTQRFTYFYGKPRWQRRVLTYAFSPQNSIDYLSRAEVRLAFQRSFARWSAVIPVNFTEVADYSSADIKIGWFAGDHNDGEPFDGQLGVLAHAFSPESGRFHLDAAETWAVDFEKERSKAAIDLESVATHEIGHVLGLAHSSVKEAVMYPSLSPRTTKVELRMDDVAGIQALYGSNPNYRYDSRLESDTSSSGWGMDLERRKQLVKWSASAALVVCLVYLGL